MTQSGGHSILFEDPRFSPRFEYGEAAQIAEVSGTSLNSDLGTGFAKFTDARIPWTIQYDEIILCLKGRFEVITDTQHHVLEALDTVWLPKGTKLTYVSQDALVFYAISPASWATGHEDAV
jgi:ethanolamine utilization protein EutQ